MNHTTGLCGSYSTQLYTTLHSFTQRFVHVQDVIDYIKRWSHYRVTIGYGGLRQFVASERRKLVRAVFLVTLVRPVYD